MLWSPERFASRVYAVVPAEKPSAEEIAQIEQLQQVDTTALASPDTVPLTVQPVDMATDKSVAMAYAIPQAKPANQASVALQQAVQVASADPTAVQETMASTAGLKTRSLQPIAMQDGFDQPDVSATNALLEEKPADTVKQPVDQKPADTTTQPVVDQKPADTATQPTDQKPADTVTQPADQKPADTVTQPADQKPADNTVTAPAESLSHTVIKGDSLWNIAKQKLGDGYRFHEIIKLNPKLRRNPDRLQPGQMLKMPDAKQ